MSFGHNVANKPSISIKGRDTYKFCCIKTDVTLHRTRRSSRKKYFGQCRASQ